jgi:hypothetical protein
MERALLGRMSLHADQASTDQMGWGREIDMRRSSSFRSRCFGLDVSVYRLSGGCLTWSRPSRPVFWRSDREGLEIDNRKADDCASIGSCPPSTQEWFDVPGPHPNDRQTFDWQSSVFSRSGAGWQSCTQALGSVICTWKRGSLPVRGRILHECVVAHALIDTGFHIYG